MSAFKRLDAEVRKIKLAHAYPIILADYHIKHGIDIHEKDSLEKIYKAVIQFLKQEKHLYNKKFACRLMEKTNKYAYILLWDELGFAEVKVVDCDQVELKK